MSVEAEPEAPPIDLAERFEELRIPPGAFRHRDHLAAAYAMLQKYPFIEATFRYARTIQTMARNAGAHDKFNTTITFAFMALIAERMESCRHECFEEFAGQHPDLFSKDLLKRFYSDERLRSPMARRIFIMPNAATPVGRR